MQTNTQTPITILHGSDGKWHLFDAVARKAFDWPPLDTKAEAENDRFEFIRDMRQLASDEASEAQS